MTKEAIPIDVVDLLPTLHKKLIDLLKSLSPEDWQKKTVAKLWTVKDVAAHLLDGNIRILSSLRDGYVGEQPGNINEYKDLIDYLNKLNADWVKAMKRVSPTMLILLHETTGQLFCEYYKSLNPFDDAQFSVAWAGEKISKNWKHIAREYTEKWLHQQQIRAAVDKPGLMSKELFYPFIDVFMLGLPFTYRDVKAANGTIVKLTVTTEIGGSWFLTRIAEEWMLSKTELKRFDSEIQIQPDIAWRLFSKSIRPEEVKHDVRIIGDKELGEKALGMVSVMA